MAKGTTAAAKTDETTTALEEFLKSPHAGLVKSPADLGVVQQMRAMALFTSYVDLIEDEESGEFSEDNFARFGDLVEVGATTFEWLLKNATDDPAALEAAFKGNVTGAMEFSFQYAGAAGELFGSDN